MITRLRLQNWKSHLDSEFRFSRGVNALIGIMGSGKSSVPEAISFALFGTTPLLQSKKITLDKLIMRKPNQQKRAKVELEFQLNGKTYFIARTIELGKGTVEAELREDGRLIDVGIQPINQEIQRILGMDFELFSKAVYSEQNGIDYFLTIPRGNRKAHLDRMLRLDRFEKARELATALLNRMKQAREEDIKHLAELEKEGVEEKLEELERQMESQRRELFRISEEKEKTKEKRQELEERLEREEELEKKRRELEKEAASREAALGELKSEIRQVKADPEVLKELQAKQEQEEKVAKELESRIEGLGFQISEIQGRIEFLRENQEKLERAENKCPVCENPLHPEKKQEILKAKEAEKEKLQAELEDKKKQLEDAKEERESCRKRVEELERRMQEVRLELKEAERQRTLKERIEKLERELTGLKEKLKAIPEPQEKELKQALQQMLAKERELETRERILKEWLEERGKRKEELLERKKLLESYRKRVEEDRRLEGEMERFIQVLKAVQEKLREEFVRTVNMLMESIWQELYPYQDFDSIRLNIDDDYILELKEAGGEWIPVDGMASGGERSLACLALRIAFSHAFVPNLKWLILDEPTHNLDSNAIEQFASILREKIDEFAEQILLITHEERLSEGLSGQVYRLEREKAENGPTRISSF